MVAMQAFALPAIFIIMTPQVSMGALFRIFSSRQMGNLLNQDKPFLDGDFLRDSSNPLDVYEDMNVTTPAPTAGQPAPAPTADAPAPAPAPDAGKGENKPAPAPAPGSKEAAAAKNAPAPTSDAGKDTGDAGKEKDSSAVQVALAGASHDTSARDGTITQQLQAPPATEEKAATKPAAAKTPATKAEPAAAKTPAAEPATKAESVPAKEAIDKPVTAAESKLACFTRKDSRAVAWWAETAPEGTPCVFGVDVRDEDSHCMYSNGDYGSNGWCYTAKDESAWGSCGDGCPLYGQPASIATKIDHVVNVLDKVSRKVDKLNGKGNALDQSTDSKDSNAVEGGKQPDAKREVTKKPDAKMEVDAKKEVTEEADAKKDAAKKGAL